MDNLPFDLGAMFSALQQRPLLSSTFTRLLAAKQPIDMKAYGIEVSTNIPWDVDNLQKFELFNSIIPHLLSFFPASTLQRLHLKRIVVAPTHWFKIDTTYENVSADSLTTHADEHASVLSLPCGQATFVTQTPLNVYDGEIIMYNFPSVVDPNVVFLYQSYTFLHEISHIYAKAAYHWKHYVKNIKGHQDYSGSGYVLSLPDGQVVDAGMHVEDFGRLIDSYGPFGSYSAGYPKDKHDGYFWLHENFADATAAYFMGFMMHPDKDFAPLPKEVEVFLHDFYAATALIDR